MSPDMSPDAFTDHQANVHCGPLILHSACLSGLVQGEFLEGRDGLSIPSA